MKSCSIITKITFIFLCISCSAVRQHPAIIVPLSTTTLASEICIYGGTSAGVIAAVQAASMGKSVILIEPGNHVGGMSVEGLGGSDINNHKEFKNGDAVGGLALSFYQKIAAYYGITNFDSVKMDAKNWRFEPHVAEQVFAEMLAAYPIKIYKGERLHLSKNGVVKDGKVITAIVMESGKQFAANQFIDATYEGDLLHWAGVTTVIGREAASQYQEAKGGVRYENPHAQFTVKVDPYLIPGKPESGLIPTIVDEPFGSEAYGQEGEGDHRLQAYCYRMCLTNVKANQIAFTKPHGYDANQYEIYLRYFAAGGNFYQPAAAVPMFKTDLGAWHDLSHNLYGMNYAYPGGNYQTRDSVLRYHRWFTQGLFYFLTNDIRVPENIQNNWRKWGLAADEFTDNQGWPRMVYIRDARRMLSDFVLTQHHASRSNPTPVADPVGVAYWPPDVHAVRRVVKDGYAYNEGFVFGGDDWRPFGVAFRSLYPKRSECTNLITPTCPSSSHIAYGAIRLEWTFMVLGQSAATAAVLAMSQNNIVQDVSYAKLEAALQKGGQVLRLSGETVH